MTIIFQRGDIFWIESIDVPITLVNAAGRVTSAGIPVKSGTYLGHAIGCRNMVNNDNSEAVGSIEFRGDGAVLVNIGDELSTIVIRVNKQAGTAGNTIQTYNVILFMRGSKARV